MVILFVNITWPGGGMRTVVIHSANKITGPYEGRLALQDLGVAQGGLIDTPDGRWFSYLFRDYGAVGRIPYLVPVKWEDGWPVLSVEGKVPERLDLPASKGLIPGIVASDEFIRRNKEPVLPLVWQWNHNPGNKFWSITERKGYLRLKTGRVDTSFLLAKNTFDSQRTHLVPCMFPVPQLLALLPNMKQQDDFGPGLLYYKERYGLVGVKNNDGKKTVVMISAESEKPIEIPSIPLSQNQVYFKC